MQKGREGGRETFICVRNTQTGKVQKLDFGPGMELIKDGSCEEISLDLYHDIRNNEPETYRLGDQTKRIYAGVDQGVWSAFRKRAESEIPESGKYHSKIEAALVYLVEGWAAGLDLARPKAPVKQQTGVDYKKEHA